MGGKETEMKSEVKQTYIYTLANHDDCKKIVETLSVCSSVKGRQRSMPITALVDELQLCGLVFDTHDSLHPYSLMVMPHVLLSAEGLPDNFHGNVMDMLGAKQLSNDAFISKISELCPPTKRMVN